MQTAQAPTAPPLVEPAWGIWFDGRAYHYHQYLYDLLPDAIAYAKLDRARPGFHDEPLPRYWKQWRGPTPEEAARMAPYRIVYENGRYCYGPYRYDLLADALDYAQHTPGGGCNGTAYQKITRCSGGRYILSPGLTSNAS